MTQPFQPQGPQPSFQGPTGQLVLNLKKPWGSLGMVTPRVLIDGYPAAVSWGRNEFTAPAGPRRIECSTTYMWDYGRAVDTVPVQPNSRVEVYYAPPMMTFLGGRIGPVEQKRPGAVVLIVVLAVLVLVIVLAVIAAIQS